MTNTNDTNDRGGRAPLSVRRPVEQSRVKQNFSHGRTKTVVVETRRKRPGSGVGVKEDDRPPVETKPSFQPQARVAPQAEKPRTPDTQPLGQRSGVVLRQLTDEEKEARDRALADARVREADERKRQEEEARRRRDQEARDQKERDAAARRKADEEARHRSEDE
ncbi:MAG: translation initiation factor IF-2 associated domain-containing protein, partial [Xanthobacteraceae bacterium]